jgi:uncharacterized protein (DUF1501 family)
MTTHVTRRRFLQTTGAMSASSLSGSALFGHMAAMAGTATTSATDYKALVCVFQYGGNDAFNTVLPRDPVSWGHYKTRRDLAAGVAASASKRSLVIDLSQQLVINSDVNGAAVEFGLHPSLVNMARLYGLGNVAILANVGPLKESTNKATYATLDPQYRPPGLQSHNDQQTLWQSGRTNTDSGGWGGRMVEALQASGKAAASTTIESRFLSVNTAPIISNFGYGDAVRTYGLTPTPEGAISMGSSVYKESKFNTETATKALIQLASGKAAGLAPTNLLEKDFAAVMESSNIAQTYLSSRLPNVALGVATPNGDMMKEFETIARMILANKNAGVTGRQVFFVRQEGYDTHSAQWDKHAALLKSLDEAIGYFHKVLSENGALDNVTTFTASDFGRQLSNNGDGTDHGWGGHHFIMGGAVAGKRIYGRIPSYVPTNSGFVDDNMIDASGVMLPGVSVDQYAATLATWMGLSPTDIKRILPKHFGTTNLGFMKPAV